MIKVTLADGRRKKVSTKDVRSVEPDGHGALLHLITGETLAVVQDVRTVELRIKAATAERDD